MRGTVRRAVVGFVSNPLSNHSCTQYPRHHRPKTKCLTLSTVKFISKSVWSVVSRRWTVRSRGLHFYYVYRPWKDDCQRWRHRPTHIAKVSFPAAPPHSRLPHILFAGCSVKGIDNEWSPTAASRTKPMIVDRLALVS